MSPTDPMDSGGGNDKLEARSFWKAGDYDVGSTKSVQEQGELEHARVHPKFLHSNATSHKWAFGAIAELVDNAVDEICKGATFVKLDKIVNVRDHTPALLIQDNGGGMDPRSMRQCMSLGYSNKKGNTIGQYGNGFKTSTMRLGADVIVFSRTTRGSRTTQSIGLLSYTFLRRTGQDDVIVPMIDFELVGDDTQPILLGSQEDWSSNLGIILEWSPYASELDLMQQFEDIGTHGTKIIVYNLWLNDDGLFELDFDNDEEDIRLRDEIKHAKSLSKHDELIESHISYRIRFSLRAYTSILYLRKFKSFDIILRGKPVQQYNIVDDLKFLEVVTYRPHLGKASKEVSVKIEIGFVKEAPLLHLSGFNVYHKNRLIRPFWKVTSDGSSRGNGVVGILEANFIEPAHDKQDFERSALYLKLETKLKQMNLDFWSSHGHLIGVQWLKKRKKGCTGQPSNDNSASIQKQFDIGQSVIGLPATTQQKMSNEQCVVSLAANMQNLSNRQTGQPSNDNSANMQRKINTCQPVVGLSATTQHKMHIEQPMVALAANIQNLSKQQTGQPSNDNSANVQRQFDTGQPVIGLSATTQQKMHIEQPVFALAANMQNLSNQQTVLGHTSDMRNDLYCAQPIIGLAADYQIGANTRSMEESGHLESSKESSVSIDQMCEENIQLFLRCEEHRQKEANLKDTINKLERELSETKRKCSQLSSYLESQKKQIANRQRTGKA